MTRSARTLLLRTFFGACATIGLLLAPAVSALFAQEKISPVSDYQYKRDYAQYENIKKEADPQKRAAYEGLLRARDELRAGGRRIPGRRRA